MLPTLKTHELLIINKLNSSINNLQRGDVIVFRHVKNDQFDGKFFIKRLIGLPGDRVLVKNGVTTIFNKENENGITLDESFVSYTDTKNDANITLGKDEYFAMGDNRSESFDSRS
jgi:signal peptidase I